MPSVWPHVSTESGGVEGDQIPANYAYEALHLAKGEIKHPVTKRWVKDYRYTWGGTMSTDELGNVTIRMAGNAFVVNAAQRGQFLQDAFSQQPEPHAGGDVLAGFGGVSSGASVYSSTVREWDKVEAKTQEAENIKAFLRRYVLYEWYDLSVYATCGSKSYH
jgi:hypothetical protein